MQSLDVFQSLWGMEQRRPDGLQRTLAEKIQAIADAGFTGVSFDMPHHSVEMVQAAQPLLEEYGLDQVFNVFVSSPEGFQDLVNSIQALPIQARFISIIGQIPAWDVKRVAKTTREWLSIGQEAGIPTLVEVHRNCMTNDLLFTLQLMDTVPDLHMVADLSHALLNQEWYLPLSSEAEALVTRVLKRSEAFHGRVGTREQAQVSFGFPQHYPWFELFQSWWKEGFQHWLTRHVDDSDVRCVFVCELGPPPYAITGADGYELSDRWEEAKILKSTAEKLWKEASRAVASADLVS